MISFNAREKSQALPQPIVPDYVDSSWEPLSVRRSGLWVGWGENKYIVKQKELMQRNKLLSRKKGGGINGNKEPFISSTEIDEVGRSLE